MTRSLILAAVVAACLSAFQAYTGFCSYHAPLPLSQEFQDGFRVWDHSRHLECGVNLPNIWLGGPK